MSGERKSKGALVYQRVRVVFARCPHHTNPIPYYKIFTAKAPDPAWAGAFIWSDGVRSPTYPKGEEAPVRFRLASPSGSHYPETLLTEK